MEKVERQKKKRTINKKNKEINGGFITNLVPRFDHGLVFIQVTSQAMKKKTKKRNRKAENKIKNKTEKLFKS